MKKQGMFVRGMQFIVGKFIDYNGTMGDSIVVESVLVDIVYTQPAQRMFNR